MGKRLLSYRGKYLSGRSTSDFLARTDNDGYLFNSLIFYLDIDYIREVVLFHSLHGFNVYFSKKKKKRHYHSYHQNWYTLPTSIK